MHANIHKLPGPSTTYSILTLIYGSRDIHALKSEVCEMKIVCFLIVLMLDFKSLKYMTSVVFLHNAKANVSNVCIFKRELVGFYHFFSILASEELLYFSFYCRCSIIFYILACQL